jgi:hypothetical protein
MCPHLREIHLVKNGDLDASDCRPSLKALRYSSSETEEDVMGREHREPKCSRASGPPIRVHAPRTTI